MLELINFEKEKELIDPAPANHKIKPLYKNTLIGLFNSFNSAYEKLAQLKEQGSIDILTVKKDLVEAREHIYQIYLTIDSILRSYRTGFGIETDSMKCDFCPEVARKYQDFHKWCVDCFSHEFESLKDNRQPDVNLQEEKK